MSLPDRGPWRLTVNEHGFIIEAGEWASDAYCVICQRSPMNDPAELHAVAHLLHAAPDLLAACKLAEAAMGNMDAANVVRAAIAKAEGRP